MSNEIDSVMHSVNVVLPALLRSVGFGYHAGTCERAKDLKLAAFHAGRAVRATSIEAGRLARRNPETAVPLFEVVESAKTIAKSARKAAKAVAGPQLPPRINPWK